MKTKTKKTNGTKKANGRAAPFAHKAKITVLAKENPKREGSEAHKVFGLYRKHRTVADFLKAGGTTAHLRWDSGHGFIRIA